VILHILLFRFKDGISETDASACLDAFRGLGNLDSVSFAMVGEYAPSAPDGHTRAAVYGFADLDALERFAHEPPHREADFLVHPYVAQFSAFDIGDDDVDLALGTAEIRRRRLDGDPELARLFAGSPAQK
jgi:hypothetical protein